MAPSVRRPGCIRAGADLSLDTTPETDVMRPISRTLRPPSRGRAPRLAAVALFAAAVASTPARAQVAPRLEIRKGDHIALIGNTLADRMQHDGQLETRLQLRFPEHELVIRSLGFSGDELSLRLRSANFGSPDEWLARVKADVIFAFFGSNESFAGKDGLAKFRGDLDAFIRHTLDQKYNGRSAPRLVVFSPIAHQNLHDPNLPDGSADNQRRALYTDAMSEVARARGVVFVDLFRATRDQLYPRPEPTLPFTVNGIHLNPFGNQRLAELIDVALFSSDNPRIDPNLTEKVCQAVLDKNHIWFNRYRTVDGYSIYGGRADLKFTDGQTNREVTQREMEVLDVMTANRDRRIWSVARGGNLPVDDSNTPPFIPVKTNKPGKNPDGSHVFLSGEEAISKMTVAKGLKVNLFASEREFPELSKPVQMTFDPKGRLWVAAWPSYPHWKPKEEMNDKLLIFEDTDGDGRADKMTVFADKLHCPTGFELYAGGVIVAQAPDLMFLRDTDGDGKADLRERILSGVDSADTHHTANSFALDPGGALYFQEGTFHHTQVETPWGPPVRSANAAVYRFEPRTFKFEVYVAYGFANPHGHAFDHWAQDIVVDGTGSNPYHGTLFSGHLDYPEKHGRPPQVYPQRTRPCPGVEFLSSRHFPDDMQGNLLVANVIGFQGILRYRIDDRGSSLAGTEAEPILSSTDPNFRPSDLKMGPDGALYFLDWQNPIIGHMQHNLRDPNRDRVHGRIYRVTAERRPLLEKVPIAGEPIESLLALLKQPEDRVRHRVRVELGGRDSTTVIAAARAWVAALDKSDPEFEHHRLEGLWLHQSHNVVNVELLKQVLQSPDFRARAAATRVLCYWRDRVPDALDLLRTLAADPYPRVRLEAVRAASFFTQPEALEVPLISAEHPTDEYLDYTRGETLRALEPYWKRAVADGHEIHFTSDVGARFFLRGIATDDLLKLSRSRPVDVELLTRKGVRDDLRKAALADLAKLDKKDELHVLIDTIRALDADTKGGREEAIVFDLVRLLTDRPTAELAPLRADLESLATGGKTAVTRQLGYVALAAADGGVDKVWALGNRSADGLLDLLTAMPLVRAPEQRAALYPKVVPLLDGRDAAMRRAAMNALTYVPGRAAETFQTLARFVRSGVDRQAAVAALQRLPASSWPKDQARPILDSLVAYVKGVPAPDRTRPEVVDALHLGESLAALLPRDESLKLRRAMGELGVRVLRLGTVPDQMLFDKDRMAVRAGKPVEVVFVNNDLMPHNFALTRPGSLQDVGQLSEASATERGALDRGYIPKTDKVLVSSRLLQPRDSQTLRFTAPAQPGVYPYVCTYPGHWRRMFGALYVVADLDDYLSDPESYLARHPLPVLDDLLKSNRPRKEWTFDELAATVGPSLSGRTFSTGKQMFLAASCVTCHKLNGVGEAIGPDLAKLDPPQSPVDILKNVLNPSEKINEKYQTYLFETQSGRVVTGLVLEEKGETIKVIENPLAKSEPVILKKTEIAERVKSPNSLMPKGLLDKLTREELLDLIAYVAARGDRDSPLFHGGHDHGAAGHGPGH
jgi:putative heme-binding domain-containing protein